MRQGEHFIGTITVPRAFAEAFKPRGVDKEASYALVTGFCGLRDILS